MTYSVNDGPSGPPGTLRGWEQKRKRPEGLARVLLMVIDREPDAVVRAVRASVRRAA